MFWKVVLTIVGFLFLNIIGAIIGFIIGSSMDRAKSVENGSFFRKENLEILFLIVGYTLRQKGSISTNDSSVISRFMHEIFELDVEERARAMECLNASKSSNFDIRHALHKFQHIKSKRTRQYIITTLIDISVNAGGGELENVIRRTIVQIAVSLGYDESNINQRIDWSLNIYAFQTDGFRSGGRNQGGYHDDQDYDHRSQRQNYNSGASLKAAYKIIGVSESDDQRAVKRAYRKLMHEYHPDKLKAQNLSPELLKEAELKAKSINAAMDVINEAKGWS